MTINSHELVVVLCGGITALLGLLLFYWIWQQYVIDSTRQQLFELRDELFDMATEGQLDRNSVLYTTLRELFNTGIRFAHQLTLWRLVIFMYTAKKLGERKFGRYAKHIGELVHGIPDDKVRSRVQSIVRKQQYTMVLHVFKRSLLLLVVIPILLVCTVIISLGVDAVLRAIKKVSLLICASVFYSEA